MSRKKGSGLGFILLIVTVAIILILAARNTAKVAPVAQQLHSGPQSVIESTNHGQPEAVEALGDLPGLGEMQQLTDGHAQDVQDALEQID